MPGEYPDDDYIEGPEDNVVDVIHPQDPKDATHILEKWNGTEYVEMGRAYSEPEARTRAQRIANMIDESIQIRLKNSWES